MPRIRIQKYLSQEGICSRRKAEFFIEKGWVSLNGEVVSEQGVTMDPDVDQVTLSDEALEEKKTHMYLAVDKPRGVVTHSPQAGETEIRDVLPEKYHHLAPIFRINILIPVDQIIAT